jgi:hypothetical protein
VKWHSERREEKEEEDDEEEDGEEEDELRNTTKPLLRMLCLKQRNVYAKTKMKKV